MKQKKIIPLALLSITLIGCGDKDEIFQPLNTDYQEATSHYEQLKELNWLVGEWETDDQNFQVSSQFDWNFNQNFLVQTFHVKKENQKEMDGQQVIAWDPTENKIRSWIFDSDGGFGKSLWTKEDDTWYTETSYTLFNGKKASAIHSYTKVDNNTYTFSSNNREIDGDVLPNIGPFTMSRQ